MSLCRLFAVVFCLIPVSAPAQITHPWPVIDHQGFMNVIYARAFDRMEAIMAQTQDMMHEGSATTEDMRVKFQDFTTTNPKVIEFVEDWVTQYPDSPYAHTAQAWVLYAIGWNVRGEKWAKDTYPEALYMHRQMLDAALGHATMAYEIDPSLIPASDAIVALGKSTDSKDWAAHVLDQVMETQPNWGTLSRSLALAQPGYGGTSELADAICEYYGPMLSQPIEDMVRYCKTVANGMYFGDRWDEVRDWVRDDPDPIWDYYRVQSMYSETAATADQVAFAVNYFKNNDVTNLRMADKFDRYYAGSPMGEPVIEIVLERAKGYARKTLEHDPYNLNALSVLLRDSYTVTKEADGTVMHRPTGIPTAVDEMDYHRRRLLAAAYHAEYWTDYARSVQSLSHRHDDRSKRLFLTDPAWINAIVYSRHGRNQVQSFFHRKITQLATLRQEQGEGWGPEWDDLAATTDWHESIICPLIRLMRLDDGLKELGKKAYGELDLEYRSKVNALRVQAKKDGKCRAEETASLDALYFSPVEVDLSVPEWVTADQ